MLELVGVGVTVTLKTTGTTVVSGTSELPDRSVVVIVAEVVVAETKGVAEEEEALLVALEDELDWAATAERRSTPAAATADHERGFRGRIGTRGTGRDGGRRTRREGRGYQRLVKPTWHLPGSLGPTQPRSQEASQTSNQKRLSAADTGHVGTPLLGPFPEFSALHSLKSTTARTTRLITF